MIKSIDDVYDYIYSFINLEQSEKKYSKTTYSIDNIKNIIKYFENILDNQKIIHIAGTKGKGSVSMFITYLLKSIGYNVSTFLSPHLIDLNERILFNLTEISNEELTEITNEIKSVIEKNKLIPTTFELIFLIFLKYSKKMNVDYLVVETGIGGKYDCTNVVKPILSVITLISIDHTNILGKSIKNITLEKSGIIKKNTPLIISKNKLFINNLLKIVAKKNNSRMYSVNRIIKLRRIKYKKNGIKFDFKYNKKYINNIFINLLGRHQIHNFLTAILAVSLINNKVLNILEKKKYISININGRIQKLNDKIIIDVAHNKDSARMLKWTLKKHYPNIKWIIVIGIVKNKDYNGIIKELSKIAEYFIVTKPSEYKESESEIIYNIAKKYKKRSEYNEDINEVFKHIINLNTHVLVTGSFYIAGPFLRLWNNNIKINNE